MTQINDPMKYVQKMMDDGRVIIGTYDNEEITIALMELDVTTGWLEVYSPSLNGMCFVDTDDLIDCKTTESVEEMIWRNVLSQYLEFIHCR